MGLADPRRAAGLAACLILGGLGLWPGDAQAYVCTRSPTNSAGSSLAWKTRNIAYAINPNVPAGLTRQAAQNAIDQAFNTWQVLSKRTNLTCPPAQTNMQFSRDSTGQSYVGYNFLAPEDNVNLIIFRDASWPYQPQRGDDVAAQTTLTYNGVTGVILDADIEFNAVQTTFTTTSTVADVRTDLQYVATHEVGHLLGFAHSINGSATMAELLPTSDAAGQLLRRQLSCDDVQIMGFRYPNGSSDVGYCFPPTGLCGFCAPPAAPTFAPQIAIPRVSNGLGGCQASAGPPSGLLASLMGWAARRSRRRAPKMAPSPGRG